jgi:NAD(P) transhydrogenase subunit beta
MEIPIGVPSLCYLIVGILFILSLGGLSHQETARRGNMYGIIGMLIALVVTLISGVVGQWPMLITSLVIGALIGGIVAQKVGMTAMPQLVAILHSFVGAAAVLVGISNYLAPAVESHESAALVHHIEIFIGIFIGAITFTGSIVAFAKLQGVWGSRPTLLPGRHFLNLFAVSACVGLGVWFARSGGTSGLTALLFMTLISLVLGVHLVAAIGSADMPVVVSMLNSYSGWAAAAAGFMLSNDLLIITGALVGSSGAILSYIMCKAMNRSIANVIFGGFGTTSGKYVKREARDGESTEVTATTADEVADLIGAARSVVIVPGYGMAVAQAQYALRSLMNHLKEHDIKMRFAIHPVAGRLPGHMNVLLAEAHIPYDTVLEMDEIHPDLPETDVVLVVGANDIVNPDALDDESSPIWGMPVIEVWRARTVVVFKRSMASGYSGIDNPLFYKENTRMMFGDAKSSVESILTHARSLLDVG